MRFHLIGLIGAAAFSLAACVTPVETTSNFDPAEVSFINARGSANISGQAFLRQRGGGIVTCAGTKITLIPAGTYARERITKIYGSPSGGRKTSLVGVSREGVDPRYYSMMRSTTCDAQGNFDFANVPNGDYYVNSGISWTIPGRLYPEGAALAQLVQIRGGKSVRVILN